MKLSAQDLEKALASVDQLIETQAQVRTSTAELRAAIKAKLGEIHNPNCDGAHCRFSTGEVRVLPTGASSNAILCRDCYEHEIRWRKENNDLRRNDAKALLPTWQTLRPYET